METNEEKELRKKLREIEDQKRKTSLEEKVSAFLDIMSELPSPIAKARLFKEYSEATPPGITQKDKRDIIEGHIALGMHYEAAGLTNYWFEEYEKAIDLYLTAARKEKSKEKSHQSILNRVYSAAIIAREQLHDTKRAIEIYLQLDMAYEAVWQAEEWNELPIALEIAEKHGFFQRARDIARNLGDKTKAEFYKRVEEVQRQIKSRSK